MNEHSPVMVGCEPTLLELQANEVTLLVCVPPQALDEGRLQELQEP